MSNTLTNDDVISAYRLILGRTPESQETIKIQIRENKNLEQLRHRLLNSNEFTLVYTRDVSNSRNIIRYDANREKKPIILVGFPRGFTTVSYRIIRDSTLLLEIFGAAGDGEVCNVDRIRAAFCGKFQPNIGFYDRSEAGFEWVSRILDLVPPGHIVKDVVQPFHVMRYLQERPDRFTVLYVNRPLEHVSFALSRRGWSYVHSVDEIHEAYAKFDQLDVEKCLFDESYIFKRISDLGYKTQSFSYINKDFISKRDDFYQQYIKSTETRQ